MQIRILKKTFAGVEYGPEQKVLKLGGEGSAGVETLEFSLPEEWKGLSVTVHVQHLDGTLPTPVLLGSDRRMVVGRTFTASEKGLWMLKAIGADGYCALTKPAKYECYETFSTEGEVEITPSQYESFVAQVLEAANRAADKATAAESAAERAEQAGESAAGCTEEAQRAMKSAQSAEENAKASAQEASAAAKRAESFAPKDGTVLSVNGKGGAVQLTATDVGAMPAGEAHVRSVTLSGRTLTVVPEDGVPQTYTTQDTDTTDLTAMTEVLGTDHGGTGKDTALTAEDVGAVASGSSGYLKAIQVSGGQMTVTLGDGSTANFTLLNAATQESLGGVKIGSGLTLAADGTVSMNAYNINTALGYDLTSTLTEMKGKIGMHEKLVLTLSCSAGHNTSTVAIPDGVDYLVARMVSPAVKGDSSNYYIATGSEYGATRLIRNGSAIALVGTEAAHTTSQLYFTNGS